MYCEMENENHQEGFQQQYGSPVIEAHHSLNNIHHPLKKSHEQIISHECNNSANHSDDFYGFRFRKKGDTSNDQFHHLDKQSEKTSYSPIPIFQSPAADPASLSEYTGDGPAAYYDYDSDYWEDERQLLRWQARRAGLLYFGMEELQKHTEQLRLSEEDRFRYLMRD